MPIPQMFNLKTKLFVFVSLLIVFNQAAVATSALLYDVEVLVVDESADTRWRVFKEGLDEVFIRISGDSIVMDKLKRPPASRYIKQYSYDPVERPALNKKGEALAHRLKIQYNGSAMETYLRDNGYPVWGEHRTDTVIWLAIRDGKNEYVLKDADQSLLKTSAEDALRRRGIPERWPLYDFKDRKILKVADIRGGFKDPVVKASKNLHAQLVPLAESLSSATYSSADMRSLRSGLLKQAVDGKFRHYTAAEQVFLAVETLCLSLSEADKYSGQMDAWFKTVEAENSFVPAQYSVLAKKMLDAL